MTKTRIYILMMALLLPLGCASSPENGERQHEPIARTGFILCPPPDRLYGESVPIRFNSKNGRDSLSVKERMSDRSRRNMMHWSSYSALGACPSSFSSGD